MYDICIVGAGIIGCFMARDLSKRELSILMIDKESDPANGSTMSWKVRLRCIKTRSYCGLPIWRNPSL